MLSEYIALKVAIYSRIAGKSSFRRFVKKTLKAATSSKKFVQRRLLWRALERGNFSYVCTRVKARKNKLLPKEEYTRLLMMELPELSRFLQERKYTVTKSDFASLESALQGGLEDNLHTILNFSDGVVREKVEHYLKRFDVYNIKTVLRGMISGSSSDDIKEAFGISGVLDKSILEVASSKEGVRQAIESLKETEYYNVLKDEFEKIEDKDNITDLTHIENALDRFYYDNLLDTIYGNSVSNKLFREFLRKEIDIINIDTLLKLRREGVDVPQGGFLDGGVSLSIGELERLSKLDFENILTQLRDHDFFPAGGEPTQITRELEKTLIKSAEQFSRIHPLSILPIIHYILAKEVEVENLRILAGGKESGLPREQIESMLKEL